MQSKSETTQTVNTAERGGCSAAPICSAFPRNPQRDADGNAVLYPGFPQYKGVAAIFATDLGEFVILAPSADALDAVVREYKIADELRRARCAIATLEPLPNKRGQR